MKHRISLNPLSKTPSHRRAMLNNMATSLFKHESINTTYPKAKTAQRFIERIITRAKNDTVHNRRQVGRHIKDAAILNKIFTAIAPLYAHRNGGYSFIVKRRHRRGDDAQIVTLELIEKSAPPAPSTKDVVAKSKSKKKQATPTEKNDKDKRETESKQKTT